MFKRCAFSFVTSSMCGLIVYMIIELIVRAVTGNREFIPISPEYLALFPSATIAMEVNILLQGVIGAAFSGMMFIYEQNNIGFLIQNLLYFLGTSVVWVPIMMLIWQLHHYPAAFIGTLIGFAGTYAIMSIVGYRVTKTEVEQINLFLEQNS